MSMQLSQQPGELVQHFFRHEYGRLLAILSKQFGTRRLDSIEDCVQSALTTAMQTWPRRGIPHDPAAWLYRTARNRMIDHVRQEARHAEIQHDLARVQFDSLVEPTDVSPTSAIVEERLRMLFLCCSEELSQESQIALALKVVAGFGIDEIARGLLTTSANIQKRITRAKEKLRESKFDPHHLPIQALLPRRDAVLLTLYLIFNEGYHSSQPDQGIQTELCQETIRVTGFLLMHPVLNCPAAEALYALMLLHAARLHTRIDATGKFLLLEQQNRQQWDQNLLQQGYAWLERSARGEELSRYHLEAAIVAEHCQATSFQSTNWQKIIDLYSLLIDRYPNTLYLLNQAIAMAYLHGPLAGIQQLLALQEQDTLKEYSHWYSALGELHRQLNDPTTAKVYFEQAIERCTNRAERELLQMRLNACTTNL